MSTVPPAPIADRSRSGVIESVHELEKPHVASDAGSTIFLGFVVGGLLFSGLVFPPYGAGTIVGAEEGTSAIAAPDGTSSMLPRYKVVVRYDDGSSMTLVYTDDVAFHRGERVVLTEQQGLVAADTTRSADQVARRTSQRSPNGLDRGQSQ